MKTRSLRIDHLENQACEATADAPGTTRRRAILREVEGAVCRDRQNTYGDAEDNFATIAKLWTVYLQATGRLRADMVSEEILMPEDVAVMSALIKVARVAVSPEHRDNWVDAAGYMVCGGGIMQARTEGGV